MQKVKMFVCTIICMNLLTIQANAQLDRGEIPGQWYEHNDNGVFWHAANPKDPRKFYRLDNKTLTIKWGRYYLTIKKNGERVVKDSSTTGCYEFNREKRGLEPVKCTSRPDELRMLNELRGFSTTGLPGNAQKLLQQMLQVKL